MWLRAPSPWNAPASMYTACTLHAPCLCATCHWFITQVIHLPIDSSLKPHSSLAQASIKPSTPLDQASQASIKPKPSFLPPRSSFWSLLIEMLKSSSIFSSKIDPTMDQQHNDFLYFSCKKYAWKLSVISNFFLLRFEQQSYICVSSSNCRNPQKTK